MLTESKSLEARVADEGAKLWQKHKEHLKSKKIQEQKEIREMLQNYWPWSRVSDARPRGLRNLRLEEIFPQQDYESAKRYVGTLDAGKMSGNSERIGKKCGRTREDPILRFQFGSKDLRKYVDNNLRYKTNKEEQMEYKKQLDEMVEEKKKRQKKEKMKEREFNAEWTEEKCKKYAYLKSKEKEPPRKHFIYAGKYRKLSPLSESQDNGVELVTLLAKDKKHPPRIPLSSTDITSVNNKGDNIRFRQGSAYLKELTRQIVSKKECFHAEKAEENNSARQHFNTWDTFWGRPGHGAPREIVKKQSLDRLLYPQMVPIGVH